MAWPPSAVLEGGARREALGGMKSELVPTALSSYNEKGDDFISHPLIVILVVSCICVYTLSSFL